MIRFFVSNRFFIKKIIKKYKKYKGNIKQNLVPD